MSAVENVPLFGPHLYEVCEGCNYNRHRCHFCGDDLSHAWSRQAEHYAECRPDLWLEGLSILLGHEAHYMDILAVTA